MAELGLDRFLKLCGAARCRGRWSVESLYGLSDDGVCFVSYVFGTAVSAADAILVDVQAWGY